MLHFDFEIPHHAPSEYVWQCRRERLGRRRRDQEALPEVWKAERRWEALERRESKPWERRKHS